ncbi:MAG: hypothetical protein U0989_15170 [Azonexus sp.]|nr:hypothetical protein [Azonexus sp.]MDZ4316095.1 hypothetical protein [Azonexus sp.]
MADLLSSSLSISPVSLPGLAGIPPAAFQRLTAGATTPTSSIFSNTSNLVELSSSGQLLSAVSLFRTNLQTLQADAANNNPTALASTAQRLVDAFNNLQGNAAGLQTVVATLSGNTLATQFTQTLSQLAAASTSIDNPTLSSLQSIGINLQATPAQTPSGSIITLNIDQNLLTAAISANPTGTQAVLTRTIQAFIGFASEFESQATNTTVSLSNLAQLGVTTTAQIDLSPLLGSANSTPQGVGVSTDLLQNLSADTVLNAIRLTDLDLAAVGLDANTLLAEDSVIRGTLVTALLTPINPTSIATITGALPANINSDTANPLADTPTPGTEPTTVEIPVTTTPSTPFATTTSITATTGNQIPITAAQAADAIATEARASAATVALQTLLADPALRAIRNHFDPAYSALIAASHLSDFVSPSPNLNPKALVNDAIRPVSPITTSRAIAYYNETTGATPSILIRG